MKGDIIVLEEHHKSAAREIVPNIIDRIMAHPTRYSITVAGESGSGKSETAQAIADELQTHGVKSVVLGQDDFFYLPPKLNDARRREDSSWLGPFLEVNLSALQENIDYALQGAPSIVKPLITYDEAVVEKEEIDLSDIKVIIAEGTYTSLLTRIDTKIFIARNRLDTLEHRKKRNRGNEVNDPFIEDVLKTEHKIIAGHIFLADFVITKEYAVQQKNIAQFEIN
jgi:uridine kinase